MARAPELHKIGDAEFEITALGGVEGMDLFDELCLRLGPSVSGAIRSAFAEKGAKAEAVVAFLLVEAMATLPTPFKLALRTRFAGLTKVKAGELWLPLGDGKKLEADGTFDQLFAGRFGLMTQWLLTAMKVSFGDFLPSSDESEEAKAAPTA